MQDDTFHSQSTKQMYRVDIEDSINQKTVYKNYEYFDDYSYSNSNAIGVYIREHKNDNMLDVFFFQDKGPSEKETLTKLLEWRRSGISNEIGHKGGGNKRNIFGFKSVKTSIYCRIAPLVNGKIIYCEIKPNNIYELALSNISEQEFRNKVDTSTYIKLPEEKDLDDLPNWYQNCYKQIYEESGIEPNYLIRMELIDPPDEYINDKKWNEYIKQVRAKQYNIPIKFKNEKLGMIEYMQYENIDLLGITKVDKEKTINLFINEQNQFYYEEDNIYINFDNGEKEQFVNLTLWGKIYMFVTNEEHSKNNLNEYNKDIDDTLKAEDVYGVYLKINDKLTNYKPVDGNLLGVSKNNRIKTETSHNTSRFRLVIIPDNNNCTAEKFNKLIVTNTIKALSGFLDLSPYKKIIRKSMHIFRDEKIKIPNPRPIPNPKPKKKEGSVYIIYLGYNLWKYGLVEDYERLETRINEHKNESIKNVKYFTQEDMIHRNATIIYKNKTSTPKAQEEKIDKILEDDARNNIKKKITRYKNNSSNNSNREYFKCIDFDHIIQVIIPKIDNK